MRGVEIDPAIKYQAEAEWMRGHPGEWIEIRECATGDAAWSAAHQISNGRRAAFRPAGTFEGASRGRTVYARMKP